MAPRPPASPAEAFAQPPGSTTIHLLRLMRLLRSGAGAMLAQAALHGQLARAEWAQEKRRLLRMLAASLFGFACLLCALVTAGVLVLALSWETAYRFPAILALLLVYAGGAGFAWHRLQALSALGDQAFAATLDELSADLALIRSKL
ncbi:hypothetical protein D3C80_187470 [compost metagenome]